MSFNDGTTTHTATYGYKESTHLVETLIQDNGTTDILAVEKRYDKLNRITAMAYAAPHNEMSSGYVYNDAGLRQFATRGSGEYWHYQYDAMGQVVAAQKHLPNKTAIPGFGYAYTYDTIGNRLSAGRDGDASRLQEYFSETGASGSPGANKLNQYRSRSVPRKLSVVGKAHANATVTVEGNTTTRTGDYFQGIVDFSGESDPDDGRYETIDVQGTYAGQGAGGTDAVAEESTDAYLPPNPEDFTYDDDGNLSADSLWNYTWNGENRLIQMETSSEAAVAGVPKQKLEFAYDYQGRRISKKVFTDHGGGYGPTPDYEQRFVYDGWNVVARINATTLATEQTYVWGTDLSGTLQGAGGVGGLLLITDYSSGTTNLYPQYDGNGNILAVIDAASGSRTATYEYGPFGNAVQKTRPAADMNPFGFSTKYADGETGLLYYGYRYYSASDGRWLSRDPIEERGGYNLYSTVANDLLSNVDFLGLLVALPDAAGFVFENEIDKELASIYSSRASCGGLACQFLPETYFLHGFDEYLNSELGDGYIDVFIGKVLCFMRRNGRMNSEFSRFEIPTLNAAGDPYTDVKNPWILSSFFLSGSRVVYAKGSVHARCTGSGVRFARSRLNLTWVDKVDANPFFANDEEKGVWENDPSLLAGIAEGMVDWFEQNRRDFRYSIDFKVEVPWFYSNRHETLYPCIH